MIRGSIAIARKKKRKDSSKTQYEIFIKELNNTKNINQEIKQVIDSPYEIYENFISTDQNFDSDIQEEGIITEQGKDTELGPLIHIINEEEEDHIEIVSKDIKKKTKKWNHHLKRNLKRYYLKDKILFYRRRTGG